MRGIELQLIAFISLLNMDRVNYWSEDQSDSGIFGIPINRFGTSIFVIQFISY